MAGILNAFTEAGIMFESCFDSREIWMSGVMEAQKVKSTLWAVLTEEETGQVKIEVAELLEAVRGRMIFPVC
jgi:hypothetical protein